MWFGLIEAVILTTDPNRSSCLLFDALWVFGLGWSIKYELSQKELQILFAL